MLVADTRETEKMPGFKARADASIALVDRVCATRAFGFVGLVAKASLVEHSGRREGDKTARFALSVVHDLHMLSGSTPA